MCLTAFAPFASCVNDDEPSTSVEYYLQIEYRNTLGTVNGISPSAKDDMLGLLVKEGPAMFFTVTTVSCKVPLKPKK